MDKINSRANYLAMAIARKYQNSKQDSERLNYNTALQLIALAFQFDDPKVQGRYLKKAERIAKIQGIEDK